jgi:hypothetical protein
MAITGKRFYMDNKKDGEKQLTLVGQCSVFYGTEK